MATLNIRALPLKTRQANRDAVYRAMYLDPQAYAANLRRLYDTDADARDTIVRHILGTRANANKVARAGQLIAEKVYQCPSEWAAQSWHKLTQLQKFTIDNAVRDALGELPAVVKTK